MLGSLLALPGCESTQKPAHTQVASGTASKPAKPDSRRCKPAPATTGSPSTLAEAVALANHLPFPVTAECFIEALDRPLQIEATRSRLSLQRAEGERSPRVFVWSAETLVITIVLDGPARDLIEFGEFVDPKRTIKAELKFPLTAPTSVEAALKRVRNPEHPEITTCFVCHDDEQDDLALAGSRSSLALRPAPSGLVDIASLPQEYERCDRQAEPARCRWLEALMSHGPVEHRAFDSSLPVF